MNYLWNSSQQSEINALREKVTLLELEVRSLKTTLQLVVKKLEIQEEVPLDPPREERPW